VLFSSSFNEVLSRFLTSSLTLSLCVVSVTIVLFSIVWSPVLLFSNKAEVLCIFEVFFSINLISVLDIPSATENITRIKY